MAVFVVGIHAVARNRLVGGDTGCNALGCGDTAVAGCRGLVVRRQSVWLAAATIIVKTLHELDTPYRAAAGCRCHEIGLQLFFLLPCLYTNVSDVWLVPNKWRRIAVSAAGIYVELLLAAVATLVWGPPSRACSPACA